MNDHLGFSLTQLRYFVVSAELGNISEAAERLCASQSTVSAAVMRLERQLGVQLLLRHHARGVSLTPSGRRLLREARAVLGQARNFQAQGDALASETTGALDVGFLASIAPFLLPLTHRLVRERHPALQLNVREESADRLLESLQDGHCELAVTYDFLSGAARFLPLVDLSIYALMADDDPQSMTGPVDLAELATRPLIALHTSAALRHFEKLFANAGVPMPEVITTTSLETMRGLVAAGSGFALMYQRGASGATLDGRNVAAVEIADALPPSSLGVATMPGLIVSSRGRAFLTALRSAVAMAPTANAMV
ncbi:LysR family transcriptional regulator [Streptomyces sp. NPDC056149]|uniref:LysR family transcriptional regulator n=1 Tax=Streptomyces sp. NPDC056149 TaxID=3345728 RepID=UPI0035D8EF44